FQWRAEVLPAVGCHQYEAGPPGAVGGVTRETELLEQRDRRGPRRTPGGPAHRVNHRVTRDEDPLCRDPLAQQLVAGTRGRGEVEVGDRRHDSAVDLLGKRL